MALGALTLGNDNVGFDATGTSMVPVSSGDNKVGKIEIKSPFETFKDTFTSMQESLGAMVGIQTKEAKRQEIIDKKLIEQRDFEIKMMNEKFADSGAAGAPMPDSNDDLAGVDTDDKTYGNFVEKAENVSGNILDTIKEAFGNVSFGPKMTAILFAGGLVFFMKYKEQLVKVLTPIVQFVKDMIDTFGPGKVFAAFVAGFILLKSGLAKKGIMKAGSLILKGIKASAAAIDKQGGLLKSMGNGFEKINRGMTSVVDGAKKTGTFITKNLTKGFDKLGSGVKAMNKGVGGAVSKLGGGFSKLFGFVGKGFMMIKVGMMSMLSSITPMIAPLLPVIAIAVGIAAVLYSLKSGFDTFKEALDNGDSMFTAVLKGLGDAMLTLVTLPATLVKKLVGFIAGLFGFDNFKAELESFSIKDKIVQVFKSLTGGMVNIIKAIAKGAAAALAAAIPGGKTPQEEFARVYGEVMKGGEGESAALQGTTDFQGDQSQADFNKDNNEKVKGYDRMGEYLDLDEGVGTGNATAISYYKKQEEEQRYRDLGTGPKANLSFDDYLKLNNITQGASGSDDFGGEGEYDDFSKEMGIVPVQSKEFEAKLERKTVMKEGKIVSDESKIIYIKGGDKQGDTITNASTTQVTGELGVNHNEMTQKILSEHF